MINAEERAAMQRTFMLRMSPQIGHVLAEHVGGFTAPGVDSLQHDLKDTLELWFRMYATGGTPLLKDASWWMVRMQDRFARLSREETEQKCDELTCFAIAAIGLLVDQGVLSFSKDAKIPEVLLSTEDPGNDPITKALLERLEASLREDDDE